MIYMVSIIASSS